MDTQAHITTNELFSTEVHLMNDKIWWNSVLLNADDVMRIEKQRTATQKHLPFQQNSIICNEIMR